MKIPIQNQQDKFYVDWVDFQVECSKVLSLYEHILYHEAI